VPHIWLRCQKTGRSGSSNSISSWPATVTSARRHTRYVPQCPVNPEVVQRPDRGPPLPEKASDLLDFCPGLHRRPDAFSGAMAAEMKGPVLSAGCHPHELLCAIA
jgi:hypothetical protein